MGPGGPGGPGNCNNKPISKKCIHVWQWHANDKRTL